MSRGAGSITTGGSMSPADEQRIRQLFADKAVTIAQINTDVHVMCNSAEDAEVVFNWLEQQIHEISPFAVGASVLCERDSPDYHIGGQVADNCTCSRGRVYVVRSCIRRPDGGWFVEIGADLHRAEDFKS